MIRAWSEHFQSVFRNETNFSNDIIFLKEIILLKETIFLNEIILLNETIFLKSGPPLERVQRVQLHPSIFRNTYLHPSI